MTLTKTIQLQKNEKDNEKKKEKNLKDIAHALSSDDDWVVEIEDPVRFNESLNKPLLDRLYTICYEKILGGLKTNIVSLSKHETTKEALSTTIYDRKIIIKLDNEMDEIDKLKCPSTYHDVKLCEGSIVVTCTSSKVSTNCTKIGYYLEDELSVEYRLEKNAKDNEKKKQQNLKAIADALGSDDEWTVKVVDPLEFNECLVGAKMQKRRDSLYTVCYEKILGGLKTNIIHLSKDEIVKDDISRAVFEKKIIIQMDNDMEPFDNVKRPDTFHDVSVQDGTLVITCTGEKANANCNKIGYHLLDDL